MTDPFGANPMGQGETGPGKLGYVLGTLLIVLGIAGGIAFGVYKFIDVQDTVDDFDRVLVFHDARLAFDGRPAGVRQ